MIGSGVGDGQGCGVMEDDVGLFLLMYGRDVRVCGWWRRRYL